MNKSKKYISYLLLIIINFTLFCSIYTCIKIKPFNIKKVINNIDYLSSTELKGRMCGTKENEKTAYFIRDQFKSIGLTPLKNNYFQSFKVSYPKYLENKSPYLLLFNKNGNLIKKYEYGKDYKEDMINFRKNNFKMNKKNTVFQKNIIKTTYNNDNFIIYSQENLNFRSSFLKDNPISMYITVNNPTMNEIQTYLKKDCYLECFIPYTIEEKEVLNVVGKIEGKNQTIPPVIISAHFDHMGIDFNNNIYPGALDNASGTAFILEMANYLKSLGKPNRDIIFIAFNAEEFGCLGSEAFVNEFKKDIKNSKVFNFDMIGGNITVPLSIMGGKDDNINTAFFRDIKNLCSNKAYLNYTFEDSSDHCSFRNANIDAVTFCDSDTTKIHTTNDKVNYIEPKNIERCFNIVSKKFISLCFSNNILLFNLNKIIFFCLVLDIILIYFIFIKKRKDFFVDNTNSV